MGAEARTVREEQLANAELRDCALCSDTTLHTHEVVLRKTGNVTHRKRQCTKCISCRTRLKSN